ncbi:SGNH/GDSL hydrolase family protein [Saccharopolyspora rhizosphaerae]|uniref:SGNH/GDSL hydrolase family protein n=1 Tax=Saccharopolyspora rhizosphaerae TaxID=2492662 RepID=A0A426JNM0_9PSEU|nr:SGNH/GDSL hydrolase family protein [Saccharopolyspora rhizosphaerae]RRO14731.1 SGNH/GDSL hydrolase family protein [Saccharopolyspora rhizosphaerae]
MYARYVAIGDSQTEGVGDGDDHSGLRGWADRLAARLAALNPDFRYANLAVRGKLIDQVHAEQLQPALELEPDLVTVVAGLNDMLRSECDGEAIAARLEQMISALTEAGARVVTVTYPDIGQVAPMARRWQPRITEFNTRVREIAAKHGTALVEVDLHPVCADRRIWSTDRLHLNSDGHALLAAATASALELPDSDTSWSEPLPTRPEPGFLRSAWEEVRWAAVFLVPWVWRRLTGRSSGDGRTAKRPQLAPLSQPTTSR